ncbi:MAG: hypothetical protein HY833_00840 [Candidatus Aenigmarchaeota archaeon]|nr:hypothetical protein [Candidatus Aenigmarchaeota archaeon]
MGLFGGPGKKMDKNQDVHSDINDVRRMVDNSSGMRMSNVRAPEESSVPTWRPQGNDEWKMPSENKWDIEHDDVNQQASAPLFVKIDRYRNLVSSLGAIKSSMGLLRSSLATMNELEKARQQNMLIVQGTVDKVEKRLAMLDKELVRPSGFTSPSSNEDYQDMHSVGATVADLKGQIQQLKSELEQM